MANTIDNLAALRGITLTPGATPMTADVELLYGYSEVEFDVYGRTGYPAPWLERKMTDEDRSRIERLILST